MIEQKVTKLNRYFDAQIALCEKRNQDLLADERGDEATFEKVKANVYDIFRTVLFVADKTSKGDPEAVRLFFIEKTQQIPSNWKAAYEKAKLHEDTIKMQIEQIKLDTINEIREQFLKIWEGTE